MAHDLLNKKDLWAEGGTLFEYVTNAWNWYAIEILLLLAVPVMALVGTLIFLRTRNAA